MCLGVDRAADKEPRETGSSNKEMFAIPRFRSLERLTEMSPSLEGVELATLVPFDMIVVRTANSNYRISLLDPDTGRAWLEGGQGLTERVEARIIGSSFGGSILRTGWIGIGLRMEACANDKYIRTSPIQSITIEHGDSLELEVNHRQN